MENITKEETKELKKLAKVFDKKFEAYTEAEKALAIKIDPIMKKLVKAKDIAGLYGLIAIIPPHSHLGTFVYREIYLIIEAK